MTGSYLPRRLDSAVVFLLATTTSAVAAFVPGSSFAASNAVPRRKVACGAANLRASAHHDSFGDAPDDGVGSQGRREFVRSATCASFPLVSSALQPQAVMAQDDSGESLTSRMFNPDGSLKSGSVEEVEAKSRVVKATFPASSSEQTVPVVSVDGATQSGTEDGDSVKVTYSVPQKWSNSEDSLYLDPSEGVNALAARRIAIYRLPAVTDEKTLDKATTIGVAKALGIPSVANKIGLAQSILGADVVSGRKSVRDGIKYYEFDLAVAPDTCDDDKNVGSTKSANLGLGFCPYDSIVLLGAAVVERRMYVIIVESDREMWKRSNADLKRVRSSFQVEVP